MKRRKTPQSKTCLMVQQASRLIHQLCLHYYPETVKLKTTVMTDTLKAIKPVIYKASMLSGRKETQAPIGAKFEVKRVWK